MARRPKDVPYTHLSIDEKSFKKGHNYVTVLSSPNAGCVVDFAEGRDKQATKSLLENTVAPEHRGRLKTVSMDMWKAYISSVGEVFPKADIVHDRFHLVKYLNDGIDKVRRRESKYQEGLKNSRFALLKNRENLTDRQQIIFEHIQAENYEVAKAWRVREDFRAMFGLSSIEEQNLDLQLDALAKAGCKAENIYREKISGVKIERPKLEEVLRQLRKGDELIVWKLDRLGRSIGDLIKTVTAVQDKGGRIPEFAGQY